MGVSSISGTADAYKAYDSSSTAVSRKTADTEKTSTSETQGVIYESSSITSMTASQRSALVEQLKADQENRQSQLASLVQDMISKQGSTYGQTDSMWSFLASGNFTVDAATKAAAQEAVSEDGYWGVSQTSQRIFDFALALSGGDVDTMKEMQEAFEKGFSEATKSWGKTLPSISSDTYDAVTSKFEEYYSQYEE